MKILFLTATYTPSTNGVAVSVNSTMEALIKKGHAVTVLAPEYPGFNSEQKNVIRYASLSNPINSDYPIPVIPINAKIINILRNESFDIVHAHHPFHIAWFAEIYAKAGKSTFVFTYHSRHEEYARAYIKFLSKDFRSQIVGLGTEYLFKRSDLIVAPSKTIENELREKYPYSEIKTIPTGINFTGKSMKNTEYLHEKYGIDKSRTILLSLSRIAPEKNIELAIKALAQLPLEFHLVIAGSGPHEEKLIEQVKALSLNNRITFTGNVDREDVPKYFSSADIFVAPSYTETQGLTLIEAMHFGVPVVTVDSEVAREWVPETLGYITENNPKSFADAILELNNNKNETMIREIKDWAAKFTTENTSERLLKAYADIIERKKVTDSLKSTGWISWSTSAESLIKFPTRNFPPSTDYYICNAPDKNKKNSDPIYGWCSWYAFSTKINETIILGQAEEIVRHLQHAPIEYLLIDDGWTRWGDWAEADKEKFPNGLKKLNETIKNLKLKPGIWMAPFLVEKDSEIFKNHKDWLVSSNGLLVEGFKFYPLIDRFWKFKRYIMDLKNPAVQKYLMDCIHSLITDKGIELLKLDFLYAPYFDRSLSTKEAGYLVSSFLSKVKVEFPDVHLNACGVPLPVAVGTVDSVRIGPDTINHDLTAIPLAGKLINNIKVRQMIKTVNKRKWTEKYWTCDPDVFVCSKQLSLKPELILEMQKTIIKNAGNKLLGDDLTRLTDEEWNNFIMPLFK